jgi:beta-glucosidase
VPQVYLGTPNTPPTGVQFAPKSLAGYDRVHVNGHQSKHVTINVPLRQLQYWSDVSGWTTATGTRAVYVGPNEHTNALSTQLNVS